MLLAIDPGACAGWALFNDDRSYGLFGQLLGAGVDPMLRAFPRPSSGRLVCERPHPGKTRAPVGDIITLALTAGAICGWFFAIGWRRPEYVLPATWKGGVKKDIVHERIRSRLTEAEYGVLVAVDKLPATKRHNALDAIGIGLWAVGRFAPGRAL